MADQKITQLTELTYDPTSASGVTSTDVLPIVDDPGGAPVTKKVTVSNLRKRMVHNSPKNVIDDYGAVGNGDHWHGGSGTDDSGAFQAAIDDLAGVPGSTYGIGKVGRLYVPNGRTYRIANTITVPTGLEIIGIGTRNEAGSPGPATLVWGGAAGGCIMSVELNNQNLASTHLENLLFTGPASTGNQPGTGLRFRGLSGSAGSIDSTTYIRNCMFQIIQYKSGAGAVGPGEGNGLELLGGATNFNIYNSRWDHSYGYGIYIATGVRMFIGGQSTSVHANGDEDGFMFCDDEDGNTTFDIHIDSFTCEVGSGGLRTTYDLGHGPDSGANPADKKGVIRCGVNPSNLEITHKIILTNWIHAVFGSNTSHSLFQVTRTGSASSTLDRVAAGKLSAIVHQGHAINQWVASGAESDTAGRVHFVGGCVPRSLRMPGTQYGGGSTPRAFPYVQFGIGNDQTYAQIQSWINSGWFEIGGLTPMSRLFADLPTTLSDYHNRIQIWQCSDVPDGIPTGARVTTGGGSNVRKLIGHPNGSGGWNWYLDDRNTGASSYANRPTTGLYVGLRHFITDCNTTTFGAAAAGGGGNALPIIYDGSQWIVG